MNELSFTLALACFAVAIVVDLVAPRRSAFVRSTPYLLTVIGALALLTVGVRSTLAVAVSTVSYNALAVGEGSLRIDQLAGLFLTLLFALAVAISLCFLTWSTSDQRHRGVAAGYSLLLASVALIVCAQNAFLFLFAWELLAVSFYVLTSVSRATRQQVRATWITLGVAKVSGAALLVGFLLLASRSGSLSIASWHAVAPGALHDVAWTLVVVGFGAKLGAIPFQVWVPVGYPAAPGPAKAALAGIGSNVAVYGLWRFLAVLGRPPVWLVIAVLLIGAMTALLGIAFAGVQSSLSRVVAFSSVENAGLILTAYGVALSGVVLQLPALVAVGILAATLQTVTHAVAKSALFVAVARIESNESSDDLDELRGVGRRMRWSGATFGAGALALAGLPPTIGFVSEWFLLEALMQQFRVTALALRLGLMGAAALVALTTGLASLVFLRVLVLTMLGRPLGEARHQREVGVFAKLGEVLLGAACLGLAAMTPLEVRYLARGLSPLVRTGVTLKALRSPWVLQPIFGGFSILSPSWLWVILPVFVLLTVLGTLVASRGRAFRVRRVPAWHSASAGVGGPNSYTAFGFANPLRHVLSNVLGTRRTLKVEWLAPVTGGVSRRSHVETETRVVEPVESYLYHPIRLAAMQASRVARRLQSGRLNAYVAYMLLALIAALAIVAGMH